MELRQFRHTVGLAWLRLRPRWGHDPGPRDVSTMISGKTFVAKPNFKYFRQNARPCYLPIYYRPQNPSKKELGQAITYGWPCEAYRWHNQKSGPACWSQSKRPSDGDWVQVIGQVRGERIRDERLIYSDIWNIVLVPVGRATEWAEIHGCQMVNRDGRDYYIGYAADIWMGNTGWHNIPYPR